MRRVPQPVYTKHQEVLSVPVRVEKDPESLVNQDRRGTGKQGPWEFPRRVYTRVQ